MALGRPSYSSFLFLCFYVLAAFHTTSDAALSSHPVQAINCSTSGNYTSTSRYAANLNQFLAALPEKTVSKNGGFFNGVVGEGPDTVYGLAMCSADYSRSDCGDCLAATASSNANGLPNLCPGSTTVAALFDPCLVRYSDTNFFGTAEIGAGPIYKLPGATVSGDDPYSDAVVRSLKEATGNAVSSPQRFAASSTDPYTMVQCTWDLPPDQCKQCLDVLSANATETTWFRMIIEGKRKSYSCTVRYSNTSFVVVPFTAAPTPQPVDQATASAPLSSSSGAAGKDPHSWHNSADVVGSVVGIILLACLAASVWYMLRLRSQRNPKGHVRKFTYSELVRATGNFTVVLGQGGFGTVYKGEIITVHDRENEVGPLLSSSNNNSEARSQSGNRGERTTRKAVAIKKQKLDTTSNETKAAAIAAFNKEIDILSWLNHRNIIRLEGWCHENDKLLLVYELVENQNLETHLYNTGASDAVLYGARPRGADLALDWRRRYNILLGIASGLDYLHSKGEKSVLHRDIKPANVMLDMRFNAKLCDFGLVTQLTHARTSQSTDVVIGSIGYMDPLLQQNYKITRDSDVYSFGVLLLEVICGRKPFMIDNSRNSLVENVRECDRRNAILEAADQLLIEDRYNEEIKGALLIGLRCVKLNRGDRPTIQVVLSELVSLTANSTPHNRHATPVYDEV